MLLTKRKRWGLVFPLVVVLLPATIIPFLYVIKISFYKWPAIPTEEPTFNYLRTYWALFTDHRFSESLLTTLKYLIAAIPLQFALGLIAALSLLQIRKGRRIIITYLLIPTMIAPVAVGAIWLLILNSYSGPVDYLFAKIGIHMTWLDNPRSAFWSIVVADTWEWMPFMAIVLYSGLLNIPTELYEVSAIDGANAWQSFWHITLPLLKPTALVSLIIRTADGMKVFGLVHILTQGGPGNSTEVLGYYLYRVGFRHWDLSKAAALTVVTLFIVTMIVNSYLRILKREGLAASS